MNGNRVEDIYIGLGGNLGNPQETLSKAIELIDDKIGSVFSRSSQYQTKPLNHPDNPDLVQADFVNMVIAAKTSFSAVEVLDKLLEIEVSLGRVRSPELRWGPRIIDLDLLLFGQEVIESESLQVPHPGVLARDFVLVPLEEIAGGLIYPGKSEPVSDLLKRFKESSLEEFIIRKI